MRGEGEEKGAEEPGSTLVCRGRGCSEPNSRRSEHNSRRRSP